MGADNNGTLLELNLQAMESTGAASKRMTLCLSEVPKLTIL